MRVVPDEAALTAAYLQRRCAICHGQADVFFPGTEEERRVMVVVDAQGRGRKRSVLVKRAVPPRDLCVPHAAARWHLKRRRRVSLDLGG